MTEPIYSISLAQWSLHRALFAGYIQAIDFPQITKEQFGIDAVEYVNSFFPDRQPTSEFVNDLKTRCNDLGTTSLLIMCDGEGNLGDPNNEARTKAIENHFKWIDAAVELGCHSIRVNAQSEGTPDEQRKLAADGLLRLTEHAETKNINVIVENHGGLSSNGAWLSSVIRKVDHPRCGTLPDFGNFILDWGTREEYDRYKGVEELMPFAKAVSAKSHDFDSEGNEIHTDYRKMLGIVLDSGYRGWIGIEYEGTNVGEFEGIIRTRDLLRKIGSERDQET
ncbi:MAG: sugar phosphate isomerase/epimerase family protein [Phycisphaerales bacterium]|jgi:sugar phosphate isomerase/epimerase|nr:sugar phosphate isomerase/epimerase family protein [Phycisphaerales bacterium]